MVAGVIEVITSIKDVALAVAGVATAIVAVKGLGTWNKQLLGTAGFDVARSLAKSTYKVRDRLQECRSPMIWAYEFPPGQRDGGIRISSTEKAEQYAFVYKNRWAPVWEALQEFDAATLEAEALWGSDIRQKTDSLRSVLSKVRAAVDSYIENIAAEGDIFSRDRDFGVEIRKTISASQTDKENPINIELLDAINKIDEAIRPHLTR